MSDEHYRLRILAGPGSGTTHRICSSRFYIGRSSICNLRIPSVFVSRIHCRLSVNHRGILLEDLQSRNGTFVNDEPVHHGFRGLRHGDRIRLGLVEFDVIVRQIPKQTFTNAINDHADSNVAREDDTLPAGD